MASRAFADTSALLALAHPRDQYHAAAARTVRRAIAEGTRFVSTPLVLAELQGLVLYRRGAAIARELVRALLRDPLYEWAEVDGELVERAAVRWLEGFPDQPFSLCDAVSFEIMRGHRLTTAFAFDAHFEVAGFRLLA